MLQRQHRRWRHDKTKSVSPPGVRNCQDFLYVYLSTVKCTSSLQQVVPNTMKARRVRFFVLLRHPQSHPHYRWLFTENIHYFITLREYDFFVGMAGGWQEKLDGEYAPLMGVKGTTTAGRLDIWFQQWKNIIQEKQDTYQCYCPFCLLQKFAPNLGKIY